MGLPKLIIGKGIEAGVLQGKNNEFGLSYINQTAAYGITWVSIISANARSCDGAISDWIDSLGRTHRWLYASTTFCATPATILPFHGRRSPTPLRFSSLSHTYPFRISSQDEGAPARSAYGSFQDTDLKTARHMTGDITSRFGKVAGQGFRKFILAIFSEEPTRIMGCAQKTDLCLCNIGSRQHSLHVCHAINVPCKR